MPKTNINVKQDPSTIKALKASLFDWGECASLGALSLKSESLSTDGLDAAAGAPPHQPSSRYDPKAMSRIVDINDLVDSGGDDSSDENDDIGDVVATGGGGGRSHSSMEVKGRRKKRPSYGPPAGILVCRQLLVLVALVGIIFAASIAIGYAVIGSGTPDSIVGGQEQDERAQQELVAVSKELHARQMIQSEPVWSTICIEQE